jgi:hypothetical protein
MYPSIFTPALHPICFRSAHYNISESGKRTLYFKQFVVTVLLLPNVFWQWFNNILRTFSLDDAHCLDDISEQFQAPKRRMCSLFKQWTNTRRNFFRTKFSVGFEVTELYLMFWQR